MKQLSQDFLKMLRSIVNRNLHEANGRSGKGLNGFTCKLLLDEIDRLNKLLKKSARKSKRV